MGPTSMCRHGVSRSEVVLSSADGSTSGAEEPQDGADDEEDAADGGQDRNADQYADEKQNDAEYEHVGCHLRFLLRPVSALATATHGGVQERRPRTGLP